MTIKKDTYLIEVYRFFLRERAKKSLQRKEKIMGIGKRILTVLIGLLFIISVTVLGSSFLAKQVLVDAISQAGIDTAISHRMMDAVFGYAGADDTEWIAKIQNKIEKNGEVQEITKKIMNEMTEDLSSGKSYKDVDVTKELNQLLEDSMQEIQDTNPELSDDMLAMMKQQLKDELDDVQDVLNSYASNLYSNMNDTSTMQGKVAKLYTVLLSASCRVAAGAAILIFAILTILLGYPRYRGLFSLGVEGLICGIIFAPGIGLMGNKILSLLTDRMLGRMIDVDLKAFFWMGCIFAGAGVAFLLAGLIMSWKDDR